MVFNRKKRLITPFGEIFILVDGNAIPYKALKGSRNSYLWPDVRDRYQIPVHFVPDGDEHSISCVFSPICEYKRGPESGEELECQGFYNDARFKMSIGVECEAGYLYGKRVSDKYDYDANYLSNGMSYEMLSDTKTERYVFGIAWIDDVGWKDGKHNLDRDIQTSYAAEQMMKLR